MKLISYQDTLKTYKSRIHGIRALSKYKDWFPLKSSPELSAIAADLMGDGHLQDEPKLRLDYTSKSIEELNRFNQEIFKLFGLKGKIRDCKTNTYGTKNLGINNKPLVRVLKLAGVPAGNKVLQDFAIPSWILNDKNNFSRFINRLFSCEGCVDISSKCIEIKMSKSLNLIEEGINFFKEIKFYLEKYFEIRTTNPFLEGRENLRKDGIRTKGIRLKIKNKESIRNFRKYIQFDNKEKADKLNSIVRT